MNYASKNLALVTIYIREPFTEKILIDQEISVFSFVSDIGGLMGLFMGFSLVSVVEVIYHAFRVSFSFFWQLAFPVVGNYVNGT